MKVITSIVTGALTAIAATFLHSYLPPLGITLSVVGSFTAIWLIGRVFGKRRYILIATSASFFIFWQAATFGIGKEIFILGDNLGSSFLILSVIALIVAVILPA